MTIYINLKCYALGRLFLLFIINVGLVPCIVFCALLLPFFGRIAPISRITATYCELDPDTLITTPSSQWKSMLQPALRVQLLKNKQTTKKCFYYYSYPYTHTHTHIIYILYIYQYTHTHAFMGDIWLKSGGAKKRKEK